MSNSRPLKLEILTYKPSVTDEADIEAWLAFAEAKVSSVGSQLFQEQGW